jgi:signal transduction histidine kinase
LAASIEDGRFQISQDNMLPSNILFALYSPEGVWLDGNSRFMDGMPPHPGRIEQTHYNGHFHWLALDVPTSLGLVRVMISSNQQAVLERMLIIWAIAFLPIALLSFFGGRVIASSAMRPIRMITKAASQLGKGDLSGRIMLTGQTDEVGELVKTFNTMATNLEQAFEREKQFTSDASHEMRTPITVIIASAEDALHDDTAESYRQSATVILSKARELQKLLTQLLTLARTGQQQSSMVLERTELAPVLRNIALEAQDWAAAKAITIESVLQTGVFAKIDLMMFTRIMVNLIDNAINYSPESSKLTITLSGDDTSAVIAVEDQGIGIAPEDLPHIFERFYRADKSRTAGTAGRNSGLGLSLVQMLVQLHGGEISVQSELGRGSKFVVMLKI